MKSLLRTRQWLLVGVVATLIGCAGNSDLIKERANQDANNYDVVVGVLSNDSETQLIVRNALKRLGIPCFMQGSLGYDVLVPKTSLEQARKCLLEEVKLNGRRVYFPPEKD